MKNTRKIGSQIRQRIEDSEYTLLCKDHREAILIDKENGNHELYTSNDHFAGFVIEIDGIGYEFVHTLTE